MSLIPAKSLPCLQLYHVHLFRPHNTSAYSRMSFPSFSLDSCKDETKIHLKPSLLTLDDNNNLFFSEVLQHSSRLQTLYISDTMTLDPGDPHNIQHTSTPSRDTLKHQISSLTQQTTKEVGEMSLKGKEERKRTPTSYFLPFLLSTLFHSF